MELLQPGDPAPWFRTASAQHPNFELQRLGGMFTVLCFFGTSQREPSQRILAGLAEAIDRSGRSDLILCGITIDPNDRSRDFGANNGKSYILWDFDRQISTRYGVMGPGDESTDGPARYRACCMVLDRRLRVLATLPFDEPEGYLALMSAVIGSLPTAQSPPPADTHAPVLQVPRVFEPELCRRLVDYYQATGGLESGISGDVDGRTVMVLDPRIKRRHDCVIEDQALRKICRERITRRLFPEILKAFQFRASWIERYVIACYEASAGGLFRRHRDDVAKGTAYRRFAVTINLNAEDYEGGDLRFPEFGSRVYRAPTGGAVVFSCSLMHEATKVTRGSRYCVLPFLYDEAAVSLRDENSEAFSTQAETAALIENSAESGDAESQYQLAVMHEKGVGMPPDLVKAHLWFSLSAARAGREWREVAASNRDRLAANMSPEELVQAQSLFTGWLPKTKARQ